MLQGELEQQKVRAGILSFEHNKAPGMNGIYPAMPKEGVEHLEWRLEGIFRERG